MKYFIQKILLLLRKYFLRPYHYWQFWIFLAIVFKSSLFAFHLSQAESSQLIPGFIGYASVDSQSYLSPVDNLVDVGSYFPDYRMPGYAVLYLPLRLVFEKAVACNILSILQLLLASISVYLLALTARNSFHSDSLFYLVFYLYAASSYANLFDDYLLSESLCTSSTIISVYFFSGFINNKSGNHLVASGLFLTWVIFLRPVYIPLLFLFCGILLLNGMITKLSIKALLVCLFIFLVPFTVLESCWVARNYTVHRRIIPLTQTFYYPGLEQSYLIELIDFVKSWGGDRTWWSPTAEIRWFGLTEDNPGKSRPLEDKNVSLPDYIFTSRFSLDSLVMIKEYLQIIDNESTSDSQRTYYTRIVKEKLVHYTQSVEEEKPFLYYVKGPLMLLIKFFVHSGTYNLFSKPYGSLSKLELMIKIFYSALYLLTLLTGTVGTLWTLVRGWNNPLAILLAGMTLYSALFFPIILRQIEFRYFVPAYPLMTIMACYFLVQITYLVRSKVQ